MKIRIKLHTVLKNETLVQARINKGYYKITELVKCLNIWGKEWKIKISYGHYVSIESMRNNPGPEIIKLLCDFFEIEPKVLFPKSYKKYVKAIKNINKKAEMIIEAKKLISGVENKKITFIQEELKSNIQQALNTLNDRSKKVLELRFFDNLTLEEVGSQLKVTQERVRQIESKALNSIKRNPTTNKYLKDFIEE